MSAHTPARWPADPEAAALFDPSNDLSLMLAAYRAGGASRDVALELADQNCRRAGHQPVKEQGR